jgi:hypothetical protein
MNPPKVRDRAYLDFLMATPEACRGTEAARVSAIEISPPAPDAFTRLLHRLEPAAEVLWQEAASPVERHHGMLVLDDSTLDKPYAKKIELRSLAGYAWTIEHYQRGLKQFCGVERAQVRAARAQRNHIGLARRAFLRLESPCYHHSISWFEAKHAIIRDAVRAYLACPLYHLISTA